MSLATEEEISELFPDCETGAVPVIGAAYGIRTAVDDALEGLDDIYFKDGDHRSLVHVSGDRFHRLMEEAPMIVSVAKPLLAQMFNSGIG